MAIHLRPLALGAGLLLATPVLAQDATIGSDAAAAEPQAQTADVPTADATSTDVLPKTADVRATSIAALQATLYDLTALKHAAHQEHWNVVGIEFYQLHDFYEHLYTDVEPHIDVVAERIRALGAAADGRPSATATAALPDEPDPAPRDAGTTLQFLLNDWSAESDALDQRLDATDEDPDTQDILIDVSRTIDKQLWMIRAHLETGGQQ